MCEEPDLHLQSIRYTLFWMNELGDFYVHLHRIICILKGAYNTLALYLTNYDQALILLLAHFLFKSYLLRDVVWFLTGLSSLFTVPANAREYIWSEKKCLSMAE